MNMVGNETQPDEVEDTETLSWRIHPVAERPFHGVLIIGMIALCTWLFWGFGEVYGWICLAVLTASVVTFFVPTDYELDEEGIEIVSLFFVRNFRPWEDFRSFYTDKVGVQLSPYSKPSRMAVYRGNFIRFSPDNREKVIALLDEHIKQRRLREKTGDKA